MKSWVYARVLFALLFVLSLAETGWGQTHQSTPQPPSTITRPDSIQDSGFYNYWANMTAQGRAGGVLLGKLSLEGEPLPWQPMLVAVDCNGSTVNLTQTDLEGRFVIRFVDNNGIEKIPADAQRQMETKYEGCIVRAVLAGFHSSEKTIKVANFRDNPDLGTIILSSEGRGGGMEVSLTTKSAPAPAMKAYEKARAEWLEQNPGSAQKSLQKAVQAYPEFAEAWLQLGKLKEDGDRPGARAAFAKALAADSDFILPYEQLAAMAAQEQNWHETLQNTSKALELDPSGTPQLWYFDALAKFQLGKMDEAQVSAEKVLAIDPRHTVPNAEQLLAVVLARKADYAGAIAHLKNCLAYTPNGDGADLIKQQIAQLEKKAAAAK